MKNFLITILIPNYNSSDFVLNTLYCLKNITRNNYKVIIRDNNSKISEYKKLRHFVKKLSNVELYRVENFKYRGSMAHGIALNDLIQKIETKYGLILDSDCTFLHKNWDEILINELSDKYPIIGTQSPTHKYQDFPYLFAIFFYVDIMKRLKIDFRPKDIIYKNQDTGFEIREKYLANGFKGKLLSIKYTLNHKSGPFHKVLCQEFYLEGYNNIFASHFWRGSTIGYWKYYKNWEKIKKKIPIIGKYIFFFLSKIAKFKGRIEKNKWIKICREIIRKNK